MARCTVLLPGGLGGLAIGLKKWRQERDARLGEQTDRRGNYSSRGARALGTYHS